MTRIEFFINISIHRSIAAKLKALGKRSYSEAISFLLDNKVDDGVRIRLDELEERIFKIEEMIQKIVSFNKLKF